MHPIKKTSAKIAFLLLGLTIIISSATFIDEQILTYAPVITFFAIGVIGFTEIGLKILTPMSSLKRFGVAEWVTGIISLILIISAIIAIPYIPIQIPILTAMAGTIGILAGLMIGVQAYV